MIFQVKVCTDTFLCFAQDFESKGNGNYDCMLLYDQVGWCKLLINSSIAFKFCMLQASV